jgi:hypothetical protein
MSSQSPDIDWSKFQNKASSFKFLRKILKIVSKYSGMGIADMVSKFKKDELIKDQMNLAALNVFLAVQAGKAEGSFQKAYAKRKTGMAEEQVDIYKSGMDDVERVTDKLALAEAERRVGPLRAKEAKATEKAKVFELVMHRVNKLLDAIENANRSLEAERGRTR